MADETAGGRGTPAGHGDSEGGHTSNGPGHQPDRVALVRAEIEHRMQYTDDDFMLGVYRQHLDVLDRHRYHCLNTYCDRCASKPCVEVASLLVLYRDVQERPRCPHIDPDRGECWIEDKPHPRHVYTGEFFGTDVLEGAENE